MVHNIAPATDGSHDHEITRLRRRRRHASRGNVETRLGAMSMPARTVRGASASANIVLEPEADKRRAEATLPAAIDLGLSGRVVPAECATVALQNEQR